MQSDTTEFESLFYNELNCNDAVYLIMNREGRILNTNRLFYKLTGFRPTDLIHKTFHIFLPEEEHVKVERCLKKVQDSNCPLTHANYVKTKNGSKILINWTNSCIRYQQKTGQAIFILSKGVQLSKPQEDNFSRMTFEFTLSMELKSQGRTPKACANCRKDHKRCEATRPCSRCLRIGRVCVEAQTKRFAQVYSGLILNRRKKSKTHEETKSDFDSSTISTPKQLPSCAESLESIKAKIKKEDESYIPNDRPKRKRVKVKTENPPKKRKITIQQYPSVKQEFRNPITITSDWRIHLQKCDL